MRRALLIGVAAVLLTGATGSAAVKPSLTVVTARTQVVAKGAGFRADESVRLRLIGKTVSAATVKATAGGAFRVLLVRPAATGCGILVLRAVGSKGSTAVVRIGRSECNPPGNSYG